MPGGLHYDPEPDRTHDDPQAAAALAAVMVTNRKSMTAPLREQIAGRLDRRLLASVGAGNRKVFMRIGAKAPKRLRVVMLLDGSGSMGVPMENNGYMSSRFKVTAQLARNLANATALVRGCRAEVWDHSTSYRTGEQAVVRRLWSSGQPTSKIDNYLTNGYHSGNIDAASLAYVLDATVESRQPDEATLILMISDGQPAYPQGQALAIAHSKAVCREAKRKNVTIIGVSVAPDLGRSEQIALYGAGNIVEYTPSLPMLARELGRVIGQAMSAHEETR